MQSKDNLDRKLNKRDDWDNESNNNNYFNYSDDMNVYLNIDKKSKYDICFDVHNIYKRPSERAFAIDKKVT